MNRSKLELFSNDQIDEILLKNQNISKNPIINKNKQVWPKVFSNDQI